MAVLYGVRIHVWMLGYTIKLEGFSSAFQKLAEEIANRRRPRHSSIRARHEVVTVSLEEIKRVGMPGLGYLAIMQRFRDGCAWQDTLYGISAKRDLLNKGWTRRPEFDSWEAFHKELSKWDTVYEDIKKNGFREVKNNIMVTHDRVFIDGKHRLAMARVLGLKEIVVRIVDV
jgi:hypothetical protein